jgi:hypothetical protein
MLALVEVFFTPLHSAAIFGVRTRIPTINLNELGFKIMRMCCSCGDLCTDPLGTLFEYQRRILNGATFRTRAEPLQLRSSSGCKRYILNALLMLRTSGCRRYTLKVTCRLNVRAHSSSSLPLQSAAYASASTRSLCAPQRAHNAVSFCPVCSPVLSPGLEIRRAPPPPATPASSRTFSCVGRLPSALLRTTCAISKFSTVLPLWRARRRVAVSNALACRQLPHCRNRRNGSAQKSPVCCRVQQTSPRWNIASLTMAYLTLQGNSTSPEPRGHQGIKLTTGSGTCSDVPTLGLHAASPYARPTPCLDFATTCYDTKTHAYALRTSDLDTEFFHTDMKVLADHFHSQPTVLYCVPTNPGPRSSVLGPCAVANGARSSIHYSTALKLAS